MDKYDHLIFRDIRTEVSRTELLKLSLENNETKQMSIDQDILSEDYTGYAMFDRFLLIKFFDKSTYQTCLPIQLEIILYPKIKTNIDCNSIS